MQANVFFFIEVLLNKKVVVNGKVERVIKSLTGICIMCDCVMAECLI